jgi:hypothetical protein
MGPISAISLAKLETGILEDPQNGKDTSCLSEQYPEINLEKPSEMWGNTLL